MKPGQREVHRAHRDQACHVATTDVIKQSAWGSRTS